jgi:hypothetical protein
MKVVSKYMFIRLLKLIVNFIMGMSGHVLAGVGFILLILGIGGNLSYAVVGIVLMALGVYLFFNFDSSISDFFNNKRKSD